MDAYYTCEKCGRKIPSINRFVHDARCSSTTSSFQPAPLETISSAADTVKTSSQRHPNDESSWRQPVSFPEEIPPSPPEAFWECPQCTFHNHDFDALCCEVCGKTLDEEMIPISEAVPLSPPQVYNHQQQEHEPLTDHWNCSTCTYLNELRSDQCQVCGNARPPLPSTTEQLVPDFIPNDNDNDRISTSGMETLPSATTFALYGAGAGAALAWMRNESVTRGALTGAGLGLTAGFLVDEFTELNRETERLRMNMDRLNGRQQSSHIRHFQDGDVFEELHRILSSFPLELGDMSIPRQQQGMREEDLAALPSHTFKATRNNGTGTNQSNNSSSSADQQQCAVCLQAYETGETVRTLPCFHQFHAQCVDQWLRQNRKCPVCKTAC